MTDNIIILIDDDIPIQAHLAARLKQSFFEQNFYHVEIQTNQTWAQLSSNKADSSAISQVGHNIIFDLCADSSLRGTIKSIGYLHVIVGGFLDGYLRPVSQASGVYEVAERSPHTDFVITSPLGAVGWTTWLHAAIPTMRTWQQNQQQLVTACADYTVLWWQECRRSNKFIRLGSNVECIGVSTAKSTPWQKLSIRVRGSFDRICSRLHRAFRRNQYWQVGWLKTAKNMAISPCHLPNQGSVWFADPYIWRDQQQRLWLLCEHYDVKGDQLGRIALFEIFEDRQAVPCGIILEEPFHLSFPRLIDHGDKLYCTVESYQSRDVRLYVSDSIDRGWKLQRKLLEGEAFIDPILIYHEDGFWYLFVNTTSVPSVKREVAPELRLFFTADLLNGEFCEHPESPLLISSRGGRNGGMLLLDQLYRVGQRTGFGGVYGKSIALFRIDELSTTTYRETPVQHPPTGFHLECLRSSLRATHLHTLNNHDRLLVFDFISS